MAEELHKEDPILLKESALLNLQEKLANQAHLQISNLEDCAESGKKKLINVESSEEKASNQARSLKASQVQESHQKPNKQKKFVGKCQICKNTGKKSEMKFCTICKESCHILCLEENEFRKKYVCDKCEGSKQIEIKESKKIKKQNEKSETEKNIQKKIDRERKKNMSNIVFQKFKAKYPYYIGENEKVKFPIEDKLLFIYNQYFDPVQNKPIPTDHPLIPSQHLGDFLELENFIVSFRKQFQEDYPCEEHKKSLLYTVMNCNGTDRIFERLLGALVKIYLKDIFGRNKTENVKILNDNCFFILLAMINETQEMTSDFVTFIAPEIIRHLCSIPSMKNAFQNFCFPEQLTLSSKLKTLKSLIQGLSEVDYFHNMVGRKSQKISELTKDKADYISKLKKNEADALSKKQKMKEMDKKREESQNNGEQKQEKKNLTKMKKEEEKSEIVIKQFKSKISNISKIIPFIISEVIFLGNDRNKSMYYFYYREPHRIYVRYHNYLLDQYSPIKIFQGKQKVFEILKSLNSKGLNEKHLYDSINGLMKDQILRNLTQEEQNSQFTALSDFQQLGECVLFETEDEFRLKIIKQIIETEDKFSTYLTIKNYRWACDEKRQQFLFGFPYIFSIQAMKQMIKTLQQNFLFVEVIKQREVMRGEQSDSNNEDNGGFQVQCLRRKKPIRLWGINSEKIKKYWLEYLQTCIDFRGIWISVFIFKKYVEKYLDKKMQNIREQERKQLMQRQRQQRQELQRLQRMRQTQMRNLNRLRSHKRDRQWKKQKNVEIQESSNSEKVLRRLRPAYRNKRVTDIMSDQNQSEKREEEQEYVKEDQSQNQDQCAICGEGGDVICCDTCPQVFHQDCLKIKQIPEGNWSCLNCLERISNGRQTRSRANKNNY